MNDDSAPGADDLRDDPGEQAAEPADDGADTAPADPEAGHETVNRESHPNAAGPEGLEGEMGVSSERSGGFEGIEGTGSQASAQHTTDGESPTVRVPHEDVESSEELDKPDDTALVSNVDRTVGEVRPDPVANKHPFDPDRNPRH